MVVSQSSKHGAQVNSSAARKSAGWILILSSFALIAILAFFGLNQKFWFLAPAEKLTFAWKQDLEILSKTNHGKLFTRVQKIKVRATDHSPAQEWIPNLNAPLMLNKQGDLTLDVFLVHQIEGHRYGVIMQYAFLDSKSGNMIDEFARTLWLGIYY